MRLSDFTLPVEDIAAAVAVSPKVKKSRDDDTIRRAVMDVVEAHFKSHVRDEVLVDLSDTLAMYEVNNGRYEDIPGSPEYDRQRSEYESGLDDAVEKTLEPYEEHLSANWLGLHTIDTRLWEDGALQAKAESAAKEIWKQLTFDRTPAQTLAGVGIVTQTMTDIIQSIRTGDTTMNAPATDVSAVLAKIKQHVGNDFDMLAVYENFEAVIEEDDDILLAGAAERLGIDGGEALILQMDAINHEDAPDVYCEALQAVTLNPSGEVRKPRTPSPDKGATEVSGANIIGALKECGASDTVLSEKMGVSRSTYVNWSKGKSKFEPNNDQYSIVRGELVTRANMLLTALAALDGTPPTQVQ